jgi:hypothetical protein
VLSCCVIYADCRVAEYRKLPLHAECHFAECRYAECCGAVTNIFQSSSIIYVGLARESFLKGSRICTVDLLVLTSSD